MNKTGRVVKVTSNGQVVRALEGNELDAESADTWTVTIQSFNGKQPNVLTNAVITYYIGDASFTLPPLNVGAAITRLLLSGRKVMVDLLPANGDGVSVSLWSVGISRGGKLLGPESGGSWASTAAANANLYNITAPDPPATTVPLVSQGQVKVYAASATVVGFGGAQALYVLLFDQGTAPGNGSQPIAGGRSSQVSAGNPSTDFGGEFTPLVANTGVFAALSTTPDLLTLAVGATFCIDLFLGVQ